MLFVVLNVLLHEMWMWMKNLWPSLVRNNIVIQDLQTIERDLCSVLEYSSYELRFGVSIFYTSTVAGFCCYKCSLYKLLSAHNSAFTCSPFVFKAVKRFAIRQPILLECYQDYYNSSRKQNLNWIKVNGSRTICQWLQRVLWLGLHDYKSCYARLGEHTTDYETVWVQLVETRLRLEWQPLINCQVIRRYCY